MAAFPEQAHRVSPRSVDRSTQCTYSPRLEVMLLISIFLLLATRGYFVPVWGSSEAREAHVAELIVSTGEWILPIRNGLVPSKPPLLHWLSAVLISTFGISGLWAARLISSVAALLVTALIAKFCADNAHPQQRRGVWWISCAVLLSSYGFFSLATDARVDMLLCFLVTAAGISLCRGLQRIEDALPSAQEETIKAMQYRVAIWCGLAVLAKGPLGIAFPALIALTAIVVAHRNLWRCLLPRLGPLVALLALVLPWYLAAAAVGGEQFIQRQVFFENLARFTGGEGITAKPWHFYAPAFLTTALPWSCVALSSCFLYRQPQVANIATATWVLGLVTLSCAEGKRAAYLLILLPWIAVQVTFALAAYCSDAGRVRKLERVLGRVIAIVFTGACVAAVGAALASDLLRNDLSLAIEQAGACALGWIVIAVALQRWASLQPEQHRPSGMRVGLQCVCLAGLAIAVASVGPAVKGVLKGYSFVAHRIAEIVPQDAALFAVRTRVDERLDPLFYALHRPITILAPANRIPDAGYLLAPLDWLEQREFSAAAVLVSAPLRDPEIGLVKLSP